MGGGEKGGGRIRIKGRRCGVDKAGRRERGKSGGKLVDFLCQY